MGESETKLNPKKYRRPLFARHRPPMASLLDDWARQESGVPGASPRGDADYDLNAVAGPSAGDGGTDMFTLDVVELEVTR